MPPLVEKWYEAYLLWAAKDWSMEALAQEIKDQIASGKRASLATLMVNGRRLSLSESSIQRMASTDERIPDVLAELVEELKAQNPAAEAKTRIVEEGLRAVHGQPTERQARDLALALLAHFPTSDLALKLADALLAQAQIGSGNGSLLDRIAWGIADRLRETKLAQQLAQQLEHLGTKRLALIVGVASVVAVAVAGGVWLVLGAVSSRARTEQASAPAPTINIYTNVGSAPLVFDTRSWLGALGELGEKMPPEQFVPDKPLPGQKLPPCLAEAYEEVMGRGCWTNIGTAKPPCGRYLYRSGDKCYRPIAADPQKPVGSNSEVHGQEPR